MLFTSLAQLVARLNGARKVCPNKWSLIWGLVYALSYDEAHATSDASCSELPCLLIAKPIHHST